MIRLATKYDIETIIDLMKSFAIEAKYSQAKLPILWSKTYIETVLSEILFGKGFILIDDKKTAILIAVKNQVFWVPQYYQLQEVMLYGKNKITILKLIKEYVRIAKQMIQDGVVHEAVITSNNDLDYTKLGLIKIETNWQI